MPASGRNVSASVPVISVCAGSCTRAREQRRAAVGIEMHRRFVEQQHRREAARLGDQRGMAQDHADQQRLLLAGGWRARRARRSPRRPAACRCGARRSRPIPPRRRGCAPGEAVAQPVLDRQRRRARQPLGDRRRPGPCARPGKPGERGGTAFIRATRARRAAVAATRVPRHGVLQPGQPGRIGAALGQQAVALRHRGLVRGDLARMAGLQRPDQPVEEAPAAGRALLEQPIHLRRQPDRGDTGGDLRLAARRGAVQAEHAAMSGSGRSQAPGPACRCRYPPRRPPWRSGRRPPSRRRRRAAAGRRCAHRAGPGPAPAATPPPAGWSCRCRSGRTAR